MDSQSSNNESSSSLSEASESTPTTRKTLRFVECHSLPTTATFKSQSIPISNSIRRTNSENELSQDEAEAEYKDFMFYSRVVQGISEKQRFWRDGYLKYENEMCLGRIVQTRHNDLLKANENDWSQETTELGILGQQNYQDQPFQDESAGETEIFVLDL